MIAPRAAGRCAVVVALSLRYSKQWRSWQKCRQAPAVIEVQRVDARCATATIIVKDEIASPIYTFEVGGSYAPGTLPKR